jgi:tetratricopeptide (TPR) repeat protein
MFFKSIVVASPSVERAPKVKQAPQLHILIPDKPQPNVGNVENFVIVWLHDSNSKFADNEMFKTQLQEIANTVQSFTDAERCYAFISGIKAEKIFMIISGKAQQSFVSKIHDAEQLQSIYLLCPDKTNNGSWISQYHEIRGVYKTVTSLSKQLKIDSKDLDRQLAGFELMKGSQSNTTSKANQQEASFMYDQLFRNIVLKTTEEDMQDLFEFCETKYRDNPREQKFINLLKTEYSSHTPAWWYSQDSFIYRMLNRALRTHQYETLYIFRVFIRHLHQQLVEEQKKQSDQPNVLFRGQIMEKNIVEEIRANTGGLLSISNFNSTTSDRKVALEFALRPILNRNQVRILMEITADKCETVPMASISKSSVFKYEEEWLFSMGSVFRIGALEHSSDGISIIHLTLTDDYDEQLHDLKNYFSQSMEDSNNCLNFANLMQQLASWKKSEYFFLKALQTETTPPRRSAILNNLGMVKGAMQKNDEALDCYLLSIELKEADGSSGTCNTATTYNNIATLYHKQSKMTEAIEYYRKAMVACESQTDEGKKLCATLYGNMAMVYNGEGKYDEALKNIEESLRICMEIFPKIHPNIASTCSSMSIILHNMGSHAAAVEYAQKAVDIDHQALPKDHPDALTHIKNLEAFKQQERDE